MKTISNHRGHAKIPTRIPKPIRNLAANVLASSILAALDADSPDRWAHLMCFASVGLGVPKARPTATSLATCLRRSLSKFDHTVGDDLLNDLTQSHTISDSSKPSSEKSPPLDSFRRRVRAKLVEGDVAGAVRVVASDSTLAKATPHVIKLLRQKHPTGPTISAPSDPVPQTVQLVASEQDVSNAIQSFNRSSSSGPDGLRPGHLRDLIGHDACEAGPRLLLAITSLVNRLLAGSISDIGRNLLLTSTLLPFKKKDGGIRPIAIGHVFRRITSKIASRHAIKTLAPSFRPVQLGVGTQGGAEAAVHATREYIERNRSNGRAIVKLDMHNAFNSVNRNHMIAAVADRCPDIQRFVSLSYGHPSSLLVEDITIESSCGVQQGDPLGPLLFALSVDSISKSISSELNCWYLDDATIAGLPGSVAADLANIIPALDAIGLTINPSKSEIIALNSDPLDQSSGLKSLLEVLPGARLTSLDSAELLGAPLLPLAIPAALAKKRDSLQQMVDRLHHIDRHTALFLLKNCFAMPKLTYILRCSPCYADDLSLSAFDSTLRSALTSIGNISLDDLGWQQATLPLNRGGLGFRSTSDVALPAFLASSYASAPLVADILDVQPADTQALSAATSLWSTTHKERPVNLSSQRDWDSIKTEKSARDLLPLMDQHRLACFAAASHPASGAWLQAVPSSSTGTLLDDETTRIGVAQRIGLPVCEPHPCRCGGTVDARGLHPLSCKRSAGRFSRHTALNDILKRGLDAAAIPSCLEPAGLDRGDGKRPDGLTLIPFSHGKSLVWDATCVDTFAATNILRSTSEAGFAASKAEEAKVGKYSTLTDRFTIQPIAVETTGVVGPSSLSFLKEIGKRASALRREPRETQWLLQRIGLAIIRGNATSIRLSG